MAIAVGGTRLLRKLCTIHARRPHRRCLTRDRQDDRTPASSTLLTQPCSPMFEIRDLPPAKGFQNLLVDARSPRVVPVRLIETAQVEARGLRIGKSHVGPKKSAQAGSGFTRQGMGV